MSLTPLGLMIGPLNRWLTESVEPAVDCAELILYTFAQNDYAVVCLRCNRPWNECDCPVRRDPSQTSTGVDAPPDERASLPTAQIPAVPKDLAASAPDRAADVAGTTGSDGP